jgi:hypothetical protein
MAGKQVYLNRKVSRLKREIAEINGAFYELTKDGDLAQHAGMLERQRDDVIRCVLRRRRVLFPCHLSID